MTEDQKRRKKVKSMILKGATIKAISDLTGVSRQSVYNHLDALVESGEITEEQSRRRSIQKKRRISKLQSIDVREGWTDVETACRNSVTEKLARKARVKAGYDAPYFANITMRHEHLITFMYGTGYKPGENFTNYFVEYINEQFEDNQKGAAILIRFFIRGYHETYEERYSRGYYKNRLKELKEPVENLIKKGVIS